MIADLTPNDDKLLNNILSVMEYAYRLGIYHGALSKDPAEIESVMNISLASKKFKIIRDAPNKPMPLEKYCDMVVMWCGRIGAMYLRNLMRLDAKIYSFRVAILIMTFVYYRDGLKVGVNYDRVDAKELLDTVARGLVHYDAERKKKRSKEWFFDEMKYRVNILYEEMKENGEASGLNRLSLFMGNTWVKYMIK